MVDNEDDVEPEYSPEDSPFANASQLKSKMVIVHSSGVFRHYVCWCSCPGSAPKHIQLFREALFSSSVISPKTAFTFDVLDHFYIDSLECKTAAMSFFQKIRRLTDNVSTSTVPVSLPLVGFMKPSFLVGWPRTDIENFFVSPDNGEISML
jgi:hypothetical protein